MEKVTYKIKCTDYDKCHVGERKGESGSLESTNPNEMEEQKMIHFRIYVHREQEGYKLNVD